MSLPAVSAASLRPLVPALFVLLWSTGFVFAKLGLLYAEPFTFLALRFAIVAVLIGAIGLATAAPWPRTARETAHFAVTGLLLHGLYLGGTFAAIAAGVPAGLAALIVGLQPLLTATVVGPLLGERVRLLQWLGLLLGFVGVALVMWEKLTLGGVAWWAAAWSALALFAITGATLYQKRFCPTMDWRTGGFVQYIAAMLLVGLAAFALETREITWSTGLLIAQAWLVIALSIGAIALLNWLIRRGAAARVASLFYLVPPAAALESWLIFGERLGTSALVGMAVAAAGVALVIRS
ncbi:MAG TPA: DMT family transporter [Alphaproteobacteria bacterium]|nr:DMT family transporter [Alphaproteobacteria bacterium]